MSTDRRVYRRRAPSVFAVCWHPGDPADALAFLDSMETRYLQPEGETWLYIVTPLSRRWIVHPGDWLVLEDGDLTCVTPRVFEATYEETL